MTADEQSSPDDKGEDMSTRLAFNFFVGTLLLALLGALWMLVQMALL
ncbi:MAG: hypothetical protein V5A22_09845 [Salinivenus sp.]